MKLPKGRARSTTSTTSAIAGCARSTNSPSDELRKGFLKLRRTVQERMSMKDQEDMTPRRSINPKSISAAIEYFFGRGELVRRSSTRRTRCRSSRTNAGCRPLAQAV